MAHLEIHPAASLQGTLTLPGDKSISHRALLTGALSSGTTRIEHLLDSQDLQATRSAIEALGVRLSQEGDVWVLEGLGLSGLQSPKASLQMGNSGTTTRLLMGILAGQSFASTLEGDASLSTRPMGRVTEPLGQMGARFQGPADHLPITLEGGSLRGIEYTQPVASAQVKSALLYAGLFAEGPTTVIEPVATRDHTERMLAFFGAKLQRSGTSVTLTPGSELTGQTFTIPGDISSAAFFLVAAAIVPDSELTLEGVGLNPTRSDLIKVLKRMGADATVTLDEGSAWERVGQIRIRSAALRGVILEPEAIPGLIDELPVLMVAATQAEGTTRMEGVGELRVKETDRIHSMVTGLGALGAKIEVQADSVVIEGPTPLRGASVESFSDHRTAMALAVAGLAAQGKTTVNGSEWVEISFPGFSKTLEQLIQR